MRRLRDDYKLGSAAARWAGGASAGLALAWLALTAAAVVIDQIGQLPPRPPTPAERKSATPGAMAKWRIVHDRLSHRLGYGPADFGAVWASRSGRICGVVTRREAGIYFRERFYTEDLTPFFGSDDERRFSRSWFDCVGDHWVDLLIGPDQTGFCAVPRNRTTALAALLCKPGPRTLVFSPRPSE